MFPIRLKAPTDARNRVSFFLERHGVETRPLFPLLEQPYYRRLFRELGARPQDFRELDPHGKESLCCGGGGGLVAIPEWEEIRMRAGRKKAEQVREAGAPIVATSCENCNLQLTDLSAHYKLGVQVVGLMELVVNALLKAKERQVLPSADAA